MTELTRTYKLTNSGAWGWVTEEAEGGGGSLPSWWTVDSTPGSESVEFASQSGVVTIGSFGDGALKVASSVEAIATLIDPDEFGLYLAGNGSYWADKLSIQFAVGDDQNNVLELEEGAASILGAVTISPTGSQSLLVKNDNGDTLLTMGSGTGATQFNLVSDFGDTFKIVAIDSNISVFHVQSDGDTQADQKIGFFSANPVTQPTGVAVNDAAIHAALVTLGLIAA